MIQRTILIASVSASLLISPGFLRSQEADDAVVAPKPLERTWQRGPLEISLRLDKQAPFVSDAVDVRWQIKAPANVEVELPKLDALPKEFQVSGTRRPAPTMNPDGSRLLEMGFRIEVLQAGNYELPALEFHHRDSSETDWITAATEPVLIEFQSLLGDEPERAEPKPNPEPAPWPSGPLPWLAIAGILAVALLAVGAFLLAWTRRSRRPRPIPMISAYRKAMEAIHRIDMADWLEKGHVDRFYTELSGVVRRYIEDRFQLRAPEQTTEEFLQELTHRPVLNRDQNLALAHFLEQCDLVKFARARPSSTEGQAALRAARDFVEATRDDSILLEQRGVETSGPPHGR